MAGALSDGVHPAPTVATVRRFQAAARRRPATGERLEGIYIAVVVMLIVLALVYNAAHSALAQAVNPIELGRWGPSLVLLALLAAGYWGTAQGPVVFSVADLGHLILGSPLSRRSLVTAPLRRGLAAAALSGAVVAGVVVVGLSGRGHAVGVARAIDLVSGLALVGILGAVAAFAVSMHRGSERLLRLVTGPVVIVAGALGLLAALAGPTGRDVALWSGPWGWALQAGAGARTGWWVAGTAGLAAVAGLATAVVWRGRGDGESERYLRRSEGHARLQASMMDLNARTARRNLTEVAGRPRRRRTARLRGLRHRLGRMGSRAAPADGERGTASGAVTAVMWRDVLIAVQRPEILVQALVAGAAGTALALLNAGHVVGVLAGGVVLYVAGARLLDPLRIENDAPGRSRVFLGARPGRALVAHAILPAVFVVAVLAVTAVVLALSGALAGYRAAPVIDLVLAGPAIVGCAALSARRGGRVPQELLMTAMSSDPSGGGVILLGWVILWPAVAAVLVALSLGRAAAAHGTSVVWAVIDLAVAAVLVRLLARD
jgi:hypothetical protein